MIFGVTSMETLIYKGLRVFLRVVLAIFEYKKSVETLENKASTETIVEVIFDILGKFEIFCDWFRIFELTCGWKRYALLAK